METIYCPISVWIRGVPLYLTAESSGERSKGSEGALGGER